MLRWGWINGVPSRTLSPALATADLVDVNICVYLLTRHYHHTAHHSKY